MKITVALTFCLVLMFYDVLAFEQAMFDVLREKGSSRHVRIVEFSDDYRVLFLKFRILG